MNAPDFNHAQVRARAAAWHILRKYSDVASEYIEFLVQIDMADPAEAVATRKEYRKLMAEIYDRTGESK